MICLLLSYKLVYKIVLWKFKMMYRLKDNNIPKMFAIWNYSNN